MLTSNEGGAWCQGWIFGYCFGWVPGIGCLGCCGCFWLDVSLGVVLVAVRQVLRATVGSLRTLSVGAVLTAISKLPLTTKKELQRKIGGCKPGTQSKATVG